LLLAVVEEVVDMKEAAVVLVEWLQERRTSPVEHHSILLLEPAALV
jgi:hypothetical protein